MMKFTGSRTLAVSVVALAAVLAIGGTQASAQGLFEMLFNRDGRGMREMPPPPPPVKRAPVRISGPSYYTYKTDELVRVDFAAIKPVREEQAAKAPAGLDAGAVGSTEKAAVAEARLEVPKVEDAEILVVEAKPQTPESEKVGTQVAEAPRVSVTTDAEFDSLLDKALTQGLDADTDSDDRAEAGPEKTPATDEPLIGEAAAKDETAPAERAVADEPAEPAVAASPARQELTDSEIAGLQAFELFAEKETAEAIVAHYTAQPEFIWVSDGKPNERARTALQVLADAASHGLDPRDYSVAVPTGTGEADLARFEMALSARMLRYAHDARSGRVDPNRISGYHDFTPKPLDRVATLVGARTSADVGAFLEAQHPRNPHYQALRVELELLRASAENEIVIAPKTLIRPGETSPEFPKILTLIGQKADAAFREAHGAVLTRHLGSETYVPELAPVIKAAQAANGLKDDGVIGPRTIQVLAGESKIARIKKVELALERLRWLPSELGERHVFLNAPAFHASYVEEGKEKLSMRAIFGQKANQTYFFQDQIEYVEFHPYWGVPRSILVNEYLPKLVNDPGYLDRAGFEVTNRKGQQVASASVEWWRYGADVPFDVRQLPGSTNALGELKILFPNRHSIYMHDTPAKQLFSRDMRALSHGCIRLQDPKAMAAAVLGWNRDQIDARLAEPHSRANLTEKVPVYVAYFTAWPDEAGKVAYYDDVYGRDDKLRAAIDKIDSLRAPSI